MQLEKKPSRNGQKRYVSKTDWGKRNDEFITRFQFQESNSSQDTYYDSIKKHKAVSFVKTSNKKMSTIAEDEN